MTADVNGRKVAADRLRKRVREARYEQGRHGRCLLCKKSFDDCPHSVTEVRAVCDAVRREDVVGKWLT